MLPMQLLSTMQDPHYVTKVYRESLEPKNKKEETNFKICILDTSYEKGSSEKLSASQQASLKALLLLFLKSQHLFCETPQNKDTKLTTFQMKP